MFLTKNPTPLYFFSWLLVMLSTTASAQQVDSSTTQAEITLKPAKCVSLRQGQVCYADVALEWRASQSGHYCLRSSSHSAPLGCWDGKHQGQYAGEIASDSNVTFSLIQQGSDKTLATAEMKMAWVYKKKRAAVSWRVF